MTTIAAPEAPVAPAVPVAPARVRLGAFTAESTFIARSFRHSVRDIDAMLMAVLLPTMLMLMFTFIFGNAIDPSGGYVDYVVPGIILLCAGFGASSTAISVSRDMTTGIIDRFRTMPLRSGAVLTGHVVASLARNLVATGVVIAVALLVGFRPVATPLEWIALVALVALYILAITYLFAAIGLAASSPEAASGYGFILLFLPYLSSAFVPVETMPEWLQWVAENQPITPVVETIRGLLMHTPVGDQGWWALGWCAGIIAVSVVWGAWLFRRRAGRR
ncbi:multidrug ABC transporter permease [Agromyces badenianii]|uniref:Transport permease protein n=1 Tax=Agromyces badenianii TaxID=2080742 RepID=A0A2S0WUT6_9MICO|nr:ABC transporter permease [Agromyces badenianii]AWB95058.1 multidrug ABC transporter permease [Agromyces badenianii]PWC03137.1 ABC transporter permease [Agromyces badenianii]